MRRVCNGHTKTDRNGVRYMPEDFFDTAGFNLLLCLLSASGRSPDPSANVPSCWARIRGLGWPDGAGVSPGLLNGSTPSLSIVCARSWR